jgi:O-antigen ligase
LIAIAQRLLGVFNWRGVLIQSDAYSYRSNATFADPNILARFLALSMALAAGMVLATGPRRTTIYLAVPALVFGAAGIIATASRSGWLALVFCGFVVVLAAPIARYTKARLTIGVFGALAAFLVFVLLQGGTDAERVRSLSQGLSVIGQRDFLIKAGWAMFKDSPVVGVGAGNYQHSLVVTYFYLVPDWAKTTLSHTSLISLVAELGLLGVFLFLFVVVRLAVTVVRTYYATKVTFNRVMVGWIGAGLLTVFLHSQSEGRFLEEPFLWVLLALLVAFETRPALAGRGAADLPERSQAVVPSARAGTIPADALGAAGGG